MPITIFTYSNLATATEITWAGSFMRGSDRAAVGGIPTLAARCVR